MNLKFPRVDRCTGARASEPEGFLGPSKNTTMSKLTPDSELELLFDAKLIPDEVKNVGDGLHVSKSATFVRSTIIHAATVEKHTTSAEAALVDRL